MGVTRRYWGEAGLVVVLVGLAVLFDRPFLLVGAAGIAGWLVARQYAFVRTVSGVAADLSITQSLSQESTRVGERVQVGLGAEFPRPAPTRIDLEASLPVGVEVTEGSEENTDSEQNEADDGRETGLLASLAVGDRTATTTFVVRCPLAGAFQFDRPTVTVTDETSRFRTTFEAGPDPRLTVNPHSPRNVHVGTGGEALEAPYGEHSSNNRGPGLDLAEIRTYVPGDEVRQIDWNATARLDKPHIREFEATTERRTILLVDCRPSMADGPIGETKFDYARQVALAVVAQARDRNEPVGVYAVGEAGLLERRPPTASEEGYAMIERRLRALEPQRPAESGGERLAESDDETVMDSPAVARRRAQHLRDDASSFATRLEPFFADADSYVEQITDDPFYGVVRTYFERHTGMVTAVVLTDDARRTETREMMKVARRYDDHVLAFLTPSALFERNPTDLEAAYDRYADFEQFRRELVNLNRVSAFEVGPGDRLEALLAANKARRRAGASD
jgi:uncharacterized protein (DUF58 family)